MPKPIKRLLRWVALPVALVLLIVGAVTLPLPLPTGVILIALGLTVAAFNPLMMRWIKRTRARYPEANLTIRRVTPHMPSFIRRVLRRTDSGGTG